MAFNVSEQFMVENSFVRLLRLGFDVRLEWPHYNFSLDMLIKQGDELIAIEFKKKDWRTVFHQCVHHSNYADIIYACMLPFERGVPHEFYNMMVKQGFGLLFWEPEYNYPFEEIIAPEPGQNLWVPFRETISERFHDELSMEVHNHNIERILKKGVA